MDDVEQELLSTIPPLKDDALSNIQDTGYKPNSMGQGTMNEMRSKASDMKDEMKQGMGVMGANVQAREEAFKEHAKPTTTSEHHPTFIERMSEGLTMAKDTLFHPSHPNTTGQSTSAANFSKMDSTPRTEGEAFTLLRRGVESKAEPLDPKAVESLEDAGEKAGEYLYKIQQPYSGANPHIRKHAAEAEEKLNEKMEEAGTEKGSSGAPLGPVGSLVRGVTEGIAESMHLKGAQDTTDRAKTNINIASKNAVDSPTLGSSDSSHKEPFTTGGGIFGSLGSVLSPSATTDTTATPASSPATHDQGFLKRTSESLGQGVREIAEKLHLTGQQSTTAVPGAAPATKTTTTTVEKVPEEREA
ncbi:hypothetical protein HDV05_008762 [Chytridiales sp. JEL 0842]|nr:hypothetical protein HDV05_008762 [Chytridiales sp. JEL 0842]